MSMSKLGNNTLRLTVIDVAGTPGNSSMSAFDSLNAKSRKTGEVRARPRINFRHLRSSFQAATGEVGWDGANMGVICINRTTNHQVTIAQYEPGQALYREDVPLCTYGGTPTKGLLGTQLLGRLTLRGWIRLWARPYKSRIGWDLNSDVSTVFSPGSAIIPQPSFGTTPDAVLRSFHAILKSEKSEVQADVSAVFTRLHVV